MRSVGSWGCSCRMWIGKMNGKKRDLQVKIWQSFRVTTVWACVGLGLASCFGSFEPGGGTTLKEAPRPIATPNVGNEQGTPKQSYKHVWHELCVSMHRSGMFDGKEETVTKQLTEKLVSWIDKNVVDQRVRAFLERALAAHPDQRAKLLANEVAQLGIRQCNFVTFILLIDCASERKSANACYQLGMSALRNERKDKASRFFRLALSLFRKRCEADGGEACVLVGLMHKLGHGTAQSDAEATRFFRKGCQAGDARGCKALQRYGDQAR